MNKIIEKVAIAIGGIDNDRCNPCTDKKIIKCKDCLDTAKRAIAAIRDAPDDSEVYNNYRCDETWRELTSKKVWQLWIDAILKE